MEMKFTKGPWERNKNLIGTYIEGRYLYTSVASVSDYYPDEHASPEEVDANARLIAAAPDLLEALQGAIDDIIQLSSARWSEVEGTEDELVGNYRAAIAKAVGG